MKISDLFGPVGSREVKSFLGCSSYFDKVKEERIEMELGDCMAGQVLVFGVCQHAWYIDITCVEFPLVACVGGITT